MQRYETMVNPPIEDLLDLADSKFRLVTVSAKRARQINSYFGQLGEGVNSPNDNGNYRPLGVLHFGLAVRPAIIASRGDIRCSC